VTKLIQVSQDALIIFDDMTDNAMKGIKDIWKDKLIANREPSMIIASKIEVIKD